MEKQEEFVSAVLCMDGRAAGAIEKHTGKFVDDVAGAGPGTVRGLAGREERYVQALRDQLPVSVLKHGSEEVWVSGHEGCAGNPVSKEEHVQHMHDAARVVEDVLKELGDEFAHVEVKLLWSYKDENGEWCPEVIDFKQNAEEVAA